MKSFENLEKWLEKRDRKITLAHEKKDRDEMQKNLDKLTMEQESIMTELHTIELLIDTIDNLHQGNNDLPVETVENLYEYNKWIKELEKSLKELGKKPKSTLTTEEKEFLEHEKAKLESEKERLDKHLTELDKIIAKSKILLIDLNETYCRDLSNGHSIASVGEALKDKFGNKMETGYSIGRWKMIKHLENHFKIKRREAVKLFDLMISAGVVIYNVEVPSSVENINFYTPYMGEFMDDVGIVNEPVYGYWVINA